MPSPERHRQVPSAVALVFALVCVPFNEIRPNRPNRSNRKKQASRCKGENKFNLSPRLIWRGQIIRLVGKFICRQPRILSEPETLVSNRRS